MSLLIYCSSVSFFNCNSSLFSTLYILVYVLDCRLFRNISTLIWQSLFCVQNGPPKSQSERAFYQNKNCAIHFDTQFCHYHYINPFSKLWVPSFGILYFHKITKMWASLERDRLWFLLYRIFDERGDRSQIARESASKSIGLKKKNNYFSQ